MDMRNALIVLCYICYKVPFGSKHYHCGQKWSPRNNITQNSNLLQYNDGAVLQTFRLLSIFFNFPLTDWLVPSDKRNLEGYGFDILLFNCTLPSATVIIKATDYSLTLETTWQWKCLTHGRCTIGQKGKFGFENWMVAVKYTYSRCEWDL